MPLMPKPAMTRSFGRAERLPVRREHRCREMGPGRVPGDDEAARMALPHEQAAAAQILDDVGDAHVRAQTVGWHRDGHAVIFEPPGQVAEVVLVEGHPVAAVDEEGQGPRLVVLGAEHVEALARVVAIRDVEFAAGGLAERGGVTLPAGDEFGVLGHPGAVVVFGFEVHGRGPCHKARARA
jgi:hypothetical protein